MDVLSTMWLLWKGNVAKVPHQQPRLLRAKEEMFCASVDLMGACLGLLATSDWPNLITNDHAGP